jgi:acetyl esterase/lipase
LVESFNATFLEIMRPKLQAVSATVTRAELNGVPVHIGRPDRAASGWANLSLHGGALVFAGGELVAGDAAMAVHRTGCLSHAVDYRMPPDHPFPAGLEDCVAAYRGLFESHAPGRIVISGRSAGDNLAAATILRLKALGLPLPGALLLLTPELDLTESGDSFETLREIDVVLKTGLPQGECDEYCRFHHCRPPTLPFRLAARQLPLPRMP